MPRPPCGYDLLRQATSTTVQQSSRRPGTPRGHRGADVHARLRYTRKPVSARPSVNPRHSRRRPIMRKFRVFATALMAVSSLAFAQDSMKKGDKSWSDLEKQLADIN